MAFRIPQFNLTCDIYTGAAGTWPVPLSAFGAAARVSGVQCALVFPETPLLYFQEFGGGFSNPDIASMILLPLHTDVRGLQQVGVTPDGIECPAGSGRTYGVARVEDRGKGHANEHRVAVCFPIVGGWNAPYP